MRWEGYLESERGREGKGGRERERRRGEGERERGGGEKTKWREALRGQSVLTLFNSLLNFSESSTNFLFLASNLASSWDSSSSSFFCIHK